MDTPPPAPTPCPSCGYLLSFDRLHQRLAEAGDVVACIACLSVWMVASADPLTLRKPADGEIAPAAAELVRAWRGQLTGLPLEERIERVNRIGEQWWWLSFADKRRPTNEQFLGAAIVPAPSFLSAVRVAKELGCNPGGEVLGYPCRGAAIPEHLRGRLLDREEVERHFADAERIVDHASRTQSQLALHFATAEFCSDCGLPLDPAAGAHGCDHPEPGLCCDCADERRGMPASKRLRARPS